VVLTSHGRARHILLDAAYFHRLEEIARGNILAALDLQVYGTADMPADLRAHILATQPSDAEIAGGKWNDD
jgi:predicted DNA-binding ribbon-helix-helix protein